MTDKRAAIDWAAIRADWLNSDKSIRWLADWYQISDKAIRNRAKSEGWGDRPASATKNVRTTSTPAVEPVIMAGIDATDPEQIVGKGHNLIFRLLEELDATTTHHTQLAEMIEAHEEDPRRRAAMLKAIELPSRANVIKALATAFKTWTEAKAPEGKKAQKQADADKVAAPGNQFAPRTGPRLAVNNR